MKKIIAGALLLSALCIPANSQPVWPQFFPVVANATALGSFVIASGPNAGSPAIINTTGYPYPSVSVTFTQVGNAGNRPVLECSNDVTFSVTGTPVQGAYRFIGPVTVHSEASGTLAPIAGETYIFPVYAQYCRVREAAYVGGTDIAIISLVGGLTGPIVVEQGFGNAASGWATFQGPYPGLSVTGTSPAVAVSMANTGTTGAVTTALPAVVGKTTYVCGFDVTAIGGTATVGPITLGLVTPQAFTFTYQMASLASGNMISKQFSPCLPASAVNQQIFMSTTADGTATAVTVNTYGFTY